MKYIYILALFTFLVSCGPDRHKPVTGVFDTTSTLEQVSGDCGSSAKEPGTVDHAFWQIDKTNDAYTLSPVSESGQPSLVFATSRDGYVFVGEVAGAVIGNCVWHLSWQTELEYTDNTIEGTHTNRLTMDCAEGFCEESWNLTGALQ